MNVKNFQKILTQALNFFSKYKPSDLIICEIDDDYKQNYWRSNPYLTVENGKGDFATCGIRLSQKSRGGPNKIMTPDEYEKSVANDKCSRCTFEIREAKRLLTDVSRSLEKFNDEDEITFVRKAKDAIKPFICVFDEVDGDFQFISLNNFDVKKVEKETVELESNEVSIETLKKLITESISS